MELRPLHVQALHTAKFDAGYTLNPRRHIHTTLNKALKLAVKWRFLNFNPASEAEIPRINAWILDYEDVPDLDMRVLEDWQAKRLLSAARETGDRLRALYVLALTTGMKQGEMLGLPWRHHVDLDSGVLRVRQTLVLVKGGFVLEGRLRTRASKWNIELRPVAAEALRLHRKHQLEERMRLGGVPEDHGQAFASTVGTPIRRQNLHRRSFKPLLKEATLPDIRFHDLRHTFASLTLAKGANINAVSKKLGHSSVKTTLDVYGHLMSGAQSAALGTLDDVFS